MIYFWVVLISIALAALPGLATFLADADGRGNSWREIQDRRRGRRAARTHRHDERPYTHEQLRAMTGAQLINAMGDLRQQLRDLVDNTVGSNLTRADMRRAGALMATHDDARWLHREHLRDVEWQRDKVRIEAEVRAISDACRRIPPSATVNGQEEPA